MSKRQQHRDAKSQGTAIARQNRRTIAAQQSEQRYQLACETDQAKLDACDDSPNLAAEFDIVRRIIQRMITDGLPASAQLPWLKIEESLSRSMIAMGLQLSILVPAGSLRDAARLIAAAVDESLAIHEPDVREAAVDWLKQRLGEALLDTDDKQQPVEMPPAKQVYTFDQPPASPNLSLGGSLRLLRFYVQQALNEGNFEFALLLIKQLITSATTQLSLAKVEGLLVSQEVSRRISLEMTSAASACINQFAPDQFDAVIDAVRARVMGPTKQQYRIIE